MKKNRLLISIVYVAASINSTVLADELTVGVGTHFGFGREYIGEFEAWAKNEDITSFRDEMLWGELESDFGKISIKGRSVKTLEATQRLAKLGLTPLLIASYGNRLYDGGSQPYSDQGREAFANYASFAAKQLNAPFVEIWNEWNIGGGTKPRISSGSVNDYLKLSQEVYKKIKLTNPKAKVLVGALGDDYPNWKWAREAMAAGLLKVADGLSVHLYNYALSREKGGAEELIRRLDALANISKEYNGGSYFPIYITEVGWPNHIGLTRTTEEDASRDAGLLLLLAKARAHIKGIWFYEYRDSGNDPLEKEHHFGLVTIQNQEKPVSCTIKTFSKLLRNASYFQEFTDKAANQYMIFNMQDGRKLLAVWRKPSGLLRPSHFQTQLNVASNEILLFSTGCPAHQSVQIKAPENSSGRYILEVTEHPKLFLLPKSTSNSSIMMN